MSEQVFVTKEELSTIQQLNNDFNKAKAAIGDIEMEKMNVIKAIENIKAIFAEHEKSLVEKYGADSVINMSTGEVTKKSEQKQ